MKTTRHTILFLILLIVLVTGAPNQASPAGSLERDARAFLFVVEFALGTPFTTNQEETILAELRRGWAAQPAQELKKFDAYPVIVESIIHASDATALETLRGKLESSIREWFETSDRRDPAVAIIGNVLKERGKILVPGNPALTEMAAASFSELYAYSELLARQPGAMPEQVSPVDVTRIRSRLLKAWSGFTSEQRARVVSTPGLWVSLRSVLRHTSASESSKIRTQLVEIAAPARVSQQPSPGRRSSNHGDIVGNIVKHQVLMNIQQQTFKHYLFCHGFKSI